MKDLKGTLLALVFAVAGFDGIKANDPSSAPTAPSASGDSVEITNDVRHVDYNPEPPKIPIKPLPEIKKALHKQAPTLHDKVINAVIMALTCANKNDIEHNHILTIIDYSLPSNQKRLWVFDLAKNKLLFHTYISHAIKSGTLMTNHFSNKLNSKTSSLGIFMTEDAYRGRHGASLKLMGIDGNFNSNAYKRFIVMHGAWYVEEDFIKKYGRPGRSWGCPVLPKSETMPIIEVIKDDTFFVVYYPDKQWLTNSKFLNCDASNHLNTANLNNEADIPEETHRQPILYVDVNKDNKREENEPIIVIKADDYQHLYKAKPPLKRMLRRQINQQEYIALTNEEFKKLITDNSTENNGKKGLEIFYLVVPDVKLKRGYYTTEMKIVSLGKIKKVTLGSEYHTVYFEHKPPAEIKTDKHFIRWLGL
ncbi:murein L,D-transpeptidase catalytic domain family protein [Candidiatus Paracoxiella cheracis]|uniref:murein L,D-transpeptidase catalytic domain family protein n=1 Tax=Candidiatus Paracoxiella cheracis TaxID=3405120 RepID=UPI003BF60495